MYIFRMNKNILMKYLGKLSHLNYEKWLFKTMIRVLIGFLIYAEKLLMYMLHLRSILD